MLTDSTLPSVCKQKPYACPTAQIRHYLTAHIPYRTVTEESPLAANSFQATNATSARKVINFRLILIGKIISASK